MTPVALLSFGSLVESLNCAEESMVFGATNESFALPRSLPELAQALKKALVIRMKTNFLIVF
jgi:hypothetical protein